MERRIRCIPIVVFIITALTVATSMTIRLSSADYNLIGADASATYEVRLDATGYSTSSRISDKPHSMVDRLLDSGLIPIVVIASALVVGYVFAALIAAVLAGRFGFTAFGMSINSSDFEAKDHEAVMRKLRHDVDQTSSHLHFFESILGTLLREEIDTDAP